MKKVLLFMSAMVFMIMSCAAYSYNYMPTAVVMEKYPECKNETAQADFVNCVKAIQEREGKVR